MALSNAQKQARWRERNVILLAADAMEIAEKLFEMDDQAKLRKIAKFINDHLKHPDRSPEERAIALGRIKVSGLNGDLSKTAALQELKKQPQDYSYRVDVTAPDGEKWTNGVRVATSEEAEIYATVHVPEEIESYVTTEVVRCDEQPLNSIIKRRGKYSLTFAHGTCGSLDWRALEG